MTGDSNATVLACGLPLDVGSTDVFFDSTSLIGKSCSISIKSSSMNSFASRAVVAAINSDVNKKPNNPNNPNNNNPKEP